MGARRPIVGNSAVVALAFTLLAACGSAGDSNASCVGPYLDSQPPSGRYGAPAPTVSPGETLTIYGHWYTSTCNDTGANEPLKPLAPVHLTLRLPGSQTVTLGEFTPHGHDMGFNAEVHIPPGASVGTATIRDDQTYPRTYRFKVRPSK